MNDVKIYKDREFGPVRTIYVNEEVLFCGSDIARALGYTNARYVVKTHCQYATKFQIPHPQSLTKQIEMSFIPESDIYLLVSSPSVPIGNRKNDFIAWMQSLGFLTKIYLRTRKEIGFGEKLMEALEPFGITLEKQWPCGNFYIDFYIPALNIAIEYDENGHKNYSYEAHELRQEIIEDRLGCKFVRVSDDQSDEYNIGYIIKQIFKL